ncbi:MAG: ribosomal-processing cysteine protease Prp [Selenomonadales bacterium]|nr:ribosomal-processing cysteine protease Prp [Selenomonadales bacterium]
MIKIKILRSYSNSVTGFCINGHAGSAPYGQDIVCAAVSALAQTALLGLTIHLKRDVSYDMEEGRLSVQLNAKPDAQTDAVLETMILGLLEIEKLHSDYITISQTGR